ncbi:MAG: hypothetical protein E7641_03520 [Ruminococcaceae bacterium]|nr:hypothetical protein [Oscillospiraceae bacterium]
MTRLAKDALLFAVGGSGYYALEVAARGFSHWTMALCGGVCLLSIFRLNERFCRRGLFVRALGGALIITAVEFATGCVVNLFLGWRVWDYSHLPMNLMGQICLPFSLLWFGLSIPICGIFGVFLRKRTKN